MSDPTISATLELSGILAALGVRHLVGGSLASVVWSEPRFTQAVDLVADLEPRHVSGLCAALGAAWYHDEELMRDAIARRRSFNVIRYAGMVKVDVFVPPAEPFHESKWARVVPAVLDPERDVTVPVTSPEDILLQKLLWFRAGDEVSEQQWRDVTSLLVARRGRLDDAYLDAWASRLEIADLLARARREV